jgi:hypothetical protein
MAAVLGAVGSLYQGYAANQAAKAQASAALQAGEANARLAEAQATDAVKRGGEREEAMRRQLSMLRGRQAAQAAAMGVEADSGSALDIRDASMLEGERDVSTNALNHAREAWGYGVQAANYRSQAAAEAAAARAQGRSAMIGGMFGAASSLLSLAAPTVRASSSSITVNPSQYAQPIGPQPFKGGLGAISYYDRLYSR